VSTTPPTTTPNPVPAQPADKTLRSGGELNEAEADLLARKHRTRLVILAGPPDSGKTTLISTIYELMRRPVEGLPQFAGSHTLVAFEQRCHRARVASGVEHPDTDRTPYSDEQKFYHLRVALAEGSSETVDLLFFDLVGERFKQLKTSAEECRRVTTLGRATFLGVLLDGNRLASNATRHLAVEECINFLQACIDSEALSGSCDVQVLITKFDQLGVIGDTSAVESVIASVRDRIKHRLARRCPHLGVVVIAARPEDPSQLAVGYGFDKLFEMWTKSTLSQSIDGSVPRLDGPFEREADAFFARQLATPTV
jgi:energy-coupling factor transporter ATP-binding protein EcfA2